MDGFSGDCFRRVVRVLVLPVLFFGFCLPVMAFDAGSVLFTEWGGQQDGQDETIRIQETLEWLDRAAREGEPEAMVLLGMMNDIGFPVNRDLDAAIGWYRMAAEKHYGKACLPLAFAYAEKGEYAKARFWFDRAGVFYRDTNADDMLVMVFGAGYLSEYIGKDRREARKEINRKRLTWLEGLAASGDPVACSMMASVYREGFGVEKDARAGDAWCKKAVTVEADGAVSERYCY